MGDKEKTYILSDGQTISKRLNKYSKNVLFPDLLVKANEDLANMILPKR